MVRISAETIGDHHLLQNDDSEHFISNNQGVSDRKQFWKSAGVAVAILDCLGFTDGHYENFVVSKKENLLFLMMRHSFRQEY